MPTGVATARLAGEDKADGMGGRVEDDAIGVNARLAQTLEKKIKVSVMPKSILKPAESLRAGSGYWGSGQTRLRALRCLRIQIRGIWRLVTGSAAGFLTLKPYKSVNKLANKY